MTHDAHDRGTSGARTTRTIARRHACADRHRRLSPARKPAGRCWCRWSLLAIGAVFAGLRLPRLLHRAERGRALLAGRDRVQRASDARDARGARCWVKLSATIAMLLGLLGRLAAPISGAPTFPARVRRARSASLYDFLLHKWYFDELYDLLFVRPAFALGRLFWKRGRRGHDRPLRARTARPGSSQLGSRVAGRLQSGYVYTYAFVMLIGLTAAVTWAIGADDAASRSSRVMLAVPAIAAVACLFVSAQRRALARAGRDADRPRARHRAVGQLRDRRRRNGSSSRTSPLFGSFGWALGIDGFALLLIDCSACS